MALYLLCANRGGAILGQRWCGSIVAIMGHLGAK